MSIFDRVVAAICIWLGCIVIVSVLIVIKDRVKYKPINMSNTNHRRVTGLIYFKYYGVVKIRDYQRTTRFIDIQTVGGNNYIIDLKAGTISLVSREGGIICNISHSVKCVEGSINCGDHGEIFTWAPDDVEEDK